MQRLIVVGGDAAGMSAASQARRLRDRDDLEIVVFERGGFTSFSACGIPYWISGMVEGRDQLIARTPEVFRRDHDIDVHLRHEVVAVDISQRTVTVRDLDTGTDRRHDYDDLLLATGAVPVRPPLPGVDARGVVGVQTLDDGQRVLDLLAERAPRRAVVVGAGYIGIEMAEAMLSRGLDVEVVDTAPQPMTSLDPDVAGLVTTAMRSMGMGVRLDSAVQAIETDEDGWVRAVTTADGSLPADVVVLGTGSRPNVELAEKAGIPIGPSRGIVTDRRQRTPADSVWAAGDCAETFHRISRQPVAIALGTIANKQGRVAGLNLAGAYGAFPGVLGTAVTKVCEIEIAHTGLGERGARDAGFEVVTATVEARTRAHYYPGAQPLTIKVVADRADGRLLGAQIVGREGAAKRIDVFATASWNEMTVEEMIDLDLSYAPPFSPVWDPVLIAARRASAALDDARAG